jgi:hypothetical protein
MHGSANSRPAAGYQADRALFLLMLSAPYQSIRLAARGQSRFQGYPRTFWPPPGSRPAGTI